MNKIIIVIMVVVIIGGGAFYAGMKYSQNKNPVLTRGTGEFMGRQGGTRASGGFANGEVLSKDDKSITLKMQDGGSKIIFYSDSTQVMKTDNGSASDITVGEQVTVNGSANSDGSITAQSVQIRPKISSN